MARGLLPSVVLLVACDRAAPQDTQTQARLDAAEARIAELERRLAEAPTAGPPPLPPIVVMPEFVRQSTSSGRPVRVHVEPTAVVVDGQTIADADLAATFARLAAMSSDRSIIMQAAGAVPHARLLEVMDQAKAAGLTRYALVTDAETARPTAR